MKRDYRRGLNRIFAVLTVGWVLFCMLCVPYRLQRDERDNANRTAVTNWQICKDTHSTWDSCYARERVDFANADRIPLFSYGNQFGWLLLVATAFPAFTYGVLYSAFLLFRWIIRGFRPDERRLN